MTSEQSEIRTILAGVSGSAVIVPGSVVAEVISYSEPKPFKDAPAWLLGEIGWRDWSVPVVSFAVLAGKASAEEAAAHSRILIIKSLSGYSSTPYLGILIDGVPRMVKVTADSLTKPERMTDFPCVFREITIGEERALIPELDELARLLQEAISEQ